VLNGAAARLAAVLGRRVRGGWPAIAAIALAVVLGHSGVAHLDVPATLAAHYRAAVGTDEWTRAIGIAQMFAAGGLVFRRTRIVTACVLGAVLAAAIANQFLTQRAGEALVSACVLAWVVVIAVGEARREGPRAGI
jgi:hypothetical protein